jgi:hypothetical protein
MTSLASFIRMGSGAAGRFALLGAGSGLLTPLAVMLLPEGLPWPSTMLVSGVPFALLMGWSLHRLSGAPLPRCALVFAMTVLAWQCAWVTAVYAHYSVSELRILSGSAAAEMALAGLAGGFVGSALTVLGIGIVSKAFRQRRAWGRTVALGTGLGILLVVDDPLSIKEVGFWVLFVVWQAGVAGSIAHELSATNRSE